MKELIHRSKIFVVSLFVLLFNSIILFGQEPGNALDFDGINDYVQIGTFWQGGQDCGYSGCKDGDLFLYSNSYTLEVWIRPSDVDGVTNQYEAIVANGNSSSQLAYSILINRSGFVSYKWFDQNTVTTKEIKTSPGSITNNRWQHIAILKSGTSLKIYINGVQHPTTGDAFNEGYLNSGKVVLLGGAPYMSVPFKGQIDEFHIWKTEARLPNIYNIVGGTNLWCNLRFNNPGSNTIPSVSSTTNYYPSNGVLYNMEVFADYVESYAMVVPKINNPANNVNGSFTANWTAPEVGAVEKYYLEIATDSTMTNKVPAYSPYVDVGNVLSYTLTGLTKGQTYYYRLRAYKSSLGDVGAYTPISRITMNVQEPGNALDFDGIDDFVQIGTSWQGQRVWNANSSTWFYGDLYLYNMAFTIEAWIRPSDVDGVTNQYEAIIANGNINSQLQYSILINRLGFASFKWYDQNTGTTKEIKTLQGSIANNRWQHISIAKPGSSTLIISINGIQQTVTGDALTNGTIEGGTVLIGDAPNLSIPFKGQIDEFHIWKSEARPPTLYNVVGGIGNLFCNLRFNNLEGNIISSISSVTSSYPSNGVMFNMDGNSDRVESYALVLPQITGPTNVGCGKFTANWTAPVTGIAEKYYLEVATDPGMINKVPVYSPYIDVGNVLTYTVTGLNPNQTYYYRLRAFKSSVGDVGVFTPVSSVTMTDAIKPVVVTQNITVSLDETGNVTITPEQINNGSTDNCTIQSITLDKTSFNCSNIGTNIVVLTVTDASGNSATGTATVTIPDNLIPAIGLITQPTLLLPSGSVVLNNLPGSGTWTVTRSPGGIPTNGTGTSTTISGLATGTYTFTVTNSSGCTSGPSASVVIGARPIQVTPYPGQSKIYNTADPALTYSVTPALQTGDSFTGNLNRDPGENPGSYPINLGTLSAGPNYTIIFVPANFIITPKPITITGVTASNKVYDGTTLASLSGGLLSGVISGDEVTLIMGTGVFADKDAGLGKAIICSGYTLSGPDALKYTVTQPEGVTADIIKANPVISWSNPSAITYGTTLSATQLNAIANVPGTFIYTPASGTMLNAGANQTLNAAFTPTDAVNYFTVSNTQVQITVNKASPVITWNIPAPIVYGTALSATQLNATGNTPGTFTYTPVSGTILNAGANQTLSVDFTPNDALNYNTVSNRQVQIIVNKASQTIIFNALAVKTCGDSPFNMSASASSGLTVNFTSSDPTVASVSGNTVTILKAGTTTITALQPGNANYNAASGVNQSLIVNELDNSVTVNGSLLTANADGVTYQWVDCNNGQAPISGQTNKTFNAVTNGSYAVIISNGGCSITSNCFNIITTGITETSQGGKIRVYPNPTSGNLTIDLDETFTKVEVIITDVNGKVSLRKSYYDTNKIDLNIDGPYGLYFITIISKTGQKTILKVIKR